MLVEQLLEMEERINVASGQVRDMIADFRPPLVEPGSGLIEYLDFAVKIHHERGGAPITFRNRLGQVVPHLSAQKILTLSRIVQEALFNIRKHAAADNVLLDLTATERYLTLTVADDGRGFDIDEVEHRSPDKGGAGLQNMRARAKAVGGGVRITQGTTEGGTAVILTLPL